LKKSFHHEHLNGAACIEERHISTTVHLLKFGRNDSSRDERIRGFSTIKPVLYDSKKFQRTTSSFSEIPEKVGWRDMEIILFPGIVDDFITTQNLLHCGHFPFCMLSVEIHALGKQFVISVTAINNLWCVEVPVPITRKYLSRGVKTMKQVSSLKC
jgi:hypothetical protein